MAMFTITLPDSVIVTSRGVEAEINTGKFTAETVVRLALHGLDQKVSDAASGAAALAVRDAHGDEAKPADHRDWLRTPKAAAAVAKHTSALMDKAARGLEANEWSQRGTGGAISEEILVQRSVARAAYKAKVGGTSPEWKDFVALDRGESGEFLDVIWAKNSAALRNMFNEEMEIRARKRAIKAVEITI